MGLFSKIKNMFKGENKSQEKELESKEKVIEEDGEKQEETKELSSAKEVEHQEEVSSEKEIKKDTSPNEVPLKRANKVYEKGCCNRSYLYS